MSKFSIVRALVLLFLVSFLAGCGGGGSTIGSSGGPNSGVLSTSTVVPVAEGPTVSVPDNPARSGTLVVQIPLANARTVKADVASFLITISQGGVTIRSQEFSRAQVAASGQQVVFDDIPAGVYDVRILYLSAGGTELGHFDQTLTVGADGVASIENPGYQNSKPDFESPRLLPEGSNITFFSTGDFNEDGMLDVVYSDRFSSATNPSRLFLCLGRGDGYFQSATRLNTKVGDALNQVLVVDLNNDNHDDIAVASEDSISVFLGVGDGTFGDLVAYGLNGGDDPFALQSADLNDDLVPDLVTANLNSGDATVLLGLGDGSFATASNYALGSSATDVEIADVNGDTVPDIIGTDYGGSTLSVWLGVGDGSFESNFSLSVGAAPTALASADLNNDGFSDLACANALDDTLTILFSDGLGGFTFETEAVGEFPVSVSFGDVDEDGLDDLVVANFGSKDFSVLLGATVTSFEPDYRVASAGFPDYADLVDINQDTNLDIVSCQTVPGGVVFSLGGADGSFETPPPKVDVGDFPLDVVSADFNSDGVTDIATADSVGNSVTVALGLGDGEFSVGTTLTGVSDCREIAVGDLNLDGNPDIAAAGANGVFLFLGNGTGGFSAPQGAVSGLTTQSVVIRDIDNDGAPDIVAGQDGSSLVRVFINEGDGQVGFPLSVNVSVGAQELEVEDYNNDGNLDIAALGSSEIVSLVLGDGTGNFGAPSLTPVPDDSGSSTGITGVNMTSGDLNGDGIMDLAVTLRGEGRIAVVPGNGDGTFGTPVELNIGFQPVEALCVDINGDDLLDIACTFSSIGGVAVRIANDDGTFQDAVFFLTDTNTYAATAADFNQDGGLDLATAESGGTVSVLLAR